MAKAFDSISHSYLSDVLRFFGFGPNFIKMILTATTNRNACIIKPDGSYTNRFELERGNAQGDCPSPLLFNLCVQILLFKLDLDPQIETYNPPHPNRPITRVRNPNFLHESNRETSRANAFADDASCITLPTFESLNAIKSALDVFASLSGLTCNVEKSTLLIVGLQGPVPNTIVNLGFKVVNNFKILGFTIDAALQTLHLSHNTTIKKMTAITNYWSRFRLSLPGRILIAKTFLYAQIGYTSSIITPTKEQETTFSNIIFGFVNNNSNIAKNRLTAPPAYGGIGLFNINDYICNCPTSNMD